MRLSEPHALTRRWALNGTAVLTSGRRSWSPDFAIRGLFAQRFGSMSRHISQN